MFFRSQCLLSVVITTDFFFLFSGPVPLGLWQKPNQNQAGKLNFTTGVRRTVASGSHHFNSAPTSSTPATAGAGPPGRNHPGNPRTGRPFAFRRPPPPPRPRPRPKKLAPPEPPQTKPVSVCPSVCPSGLSVFFFFRAKPCPICKGCLCRGKDGDSAHGGA